MNLVDVMHKKRRSLLSSSVLLVAFGTVGVQGAQKSDFLKVGSDELFFQVTGQGYPLVLVSGGSGMDLRQWHRVAADLSEEFRVVTYDPRGVGRSDNPTSSYSDVADLSQLLDHLGLQRVGLIGLSSAGGFVLEFAASRPQRVSGVVASAPFVPGFDFSQSMLDRLDVFNRAAQSGRDAFLDAMFAGAHFIPAPLDRSVRSQARNIMAENFDKGAEFDPSFQSTPDPPLIETISNITTAVLLVAGELDHAEVLRRNAFLADEIPSSTTSIVSDAGHNVPLENPAGFLSAIQPFLQQLR